MGNVDACQQLKKIVIPDKAKSMATLQPVCCVKLVDFQVALLQHGVMLRKKLLTIIGTFSHGSSPPYTINGT